jgi:hypothetical protein
MSIHDLPADAQDGWGLDAPDCGTDTDTGVVPDLPLRVGGDGGTWGDARDRLVSDLRGPENPTTLTEVSRKTAENQYRQFSPAWSEYIWRRLLVHHRRLRGWTEATVLLTFTGRTTLPGADRPMPPVTHCERIRESRENRNTALSKAMSDVDRWSSITVVGVHETGHIHVHTGVWANEWLCRERFEPVVGAHIRNSPVADEDGHGDRAITVRSDSAGLTGELGKNGPGLDTRGDRSHGVLSEAEHRQFGATVLEVGGCRAVRF